jgi:hypothetical protein
MKINTKQNTRQDTKKKNALILVSVIILSAVLMYGTYAYSNRLYPFNSTNIPDKEGRKISTEKSDYEKSVEEQLKEDPNQKTKTGVDVPSAPTVNDTSGKQEANVLLTSVNIQRGQVTARGFASNVVELDGVCTFTFTKGGETIVKKTSVLSSTTSTPCQAASFPADELSPGTWSVGLKYESSQSSGQADPMELHV